jgi:hypothetical protein
MDGMDGMEFLSFFFVVIQQVTTKTKTMSSNYTFALNRRPAPAAPAPAPASLAAYRAPAPASLAPASAPVNSSNRFSLNRLINLKSTGGCRSCS